MVEANTTLSVNPIDLSVGEIVDCAVEQIMPYGAFVRIAKTGRKGMIHSSELSYSFVKNITDVLNIGDKIQAKVIRIDEKGRIDLSLKQTQEPPQREPRQQRQSSRPARPEGRNFSAPSGGRDFTQSPREGTPSRPSSSPNFQARPSGSQNFPSSPRTHRDREFAQREVRDFRAMQEEYREAHPEEADTFEKKMASFLKTSEAKITDLNARSTARAGRPSRRRQNSRDF